MRATLLALIVTTCRLAILSAMVYGCLNCPPKFRPIAVAATLILAVRYGGEHD